MSSDDLRKKGISRRDFVKTAGAGTLAAAGAALALPMAGCVRPQGGAAVVPDSARIPDKWELEADVVIIGAGAVGLPAAIAAADGGAAVIVVEANYDVGGHAMLGGGNVALGGGTGLQKKYGIKDDPDTVFRDLTDWSVVEVDGMPNYRFNDRALQRALADNMVPAYDLLIANGVKFVDKAPDNRAAHTIGISAKREHHCAWDKGANLESPAGKNGAALVRPLEESARKKGVRFLLNYHMDVIYREAPNAGRVLGIQAHYTPTILPGASTPMASLRSDGNISMTAQTVTVKAKKAVIIATGGHNANVNFRRMFDPRLTEEYADCGEEYSVNDASGELAAMAIGAGLWGLANQTINATCGLLKCDFLGCRPQFLSWPTNSPLFPKVKATGLRVRDWQDVILVNQAGKRFYDETRGGYPEGSFEGFYDKVGGYVPGDWRNATKLGYKPESFIDAALAMNEGSGPPDYSAGPQWAIFDSEAVKREKWSTEPPAVDPNLFFSADSLRELADKINTCSYQKYKMSGEVLEATVKRYNSFVANKKDPDFEKPEPKFTIAKAPFYAAWGSIYMHDSYVGLRINENCQVLDIYGKIIPGLYCGGESAGGSSQHGFGRCFPQALIAAKHILKG